MKARLTILTAVVLQLAVGTAQAGDGERRTVCGRLGECGGLAVLEVWGTPQEAGFAHGYLRAEAIVRLFDEAVLDPSVGVAPAVYEGLLLAASRRLFTWQPEYERELEGLLRGVRAKLGEEGARSAKLDRPLELDDLKAVNTLADWRGTLCSTVSVWGGLTSDGRTLTARNLDYPATAEMRRAQCIVIRRGEGAARTWVGVGWPGLIGVYTAMNDAGVTIAIHDSGALPRSYDSGFTPRSLALREALESAGAETHLADVRRVLQKRRVIVGNNVHVSGPQLAGRPAVGVFEYDGNERDHGVTLRLADSNGGGVSDALWCTNHMRSRLEPRVGRRYEALARRLGELTSSSGKIDAGRAFELIECARRHDTLHTVLFVPGERRMFVQVRDVAGEAELRLDEWLARPTSTSQPVMGSKP